MQIKGWMPGAVIAVNIGFMALTHLFLKVEIEHSEKDTPEKLAGEIRRQLLKLYGVRDVELSSYNVVEE
jgi:hypothetical protein